MGCLSNNGHWILDDSVKYHLVEVCVKLKKRICQLSKAKEVRKMPDHSGCVVDHVQCAGCKQWLPLNAKFFFVSKVTTTGYRGTCKECHKKRRISYRMKENTKVWFSVRSAAAKDRIKGKGLSFRITIEDLDYPTHCPITGLKLTYNTSGGGKGRNRNFHAASIDRIDSNLGYVPGNVRVVSSIANTMKNSLGEDDFLNLIEMIYNTCISKDELECKCRTVA
tara:strand:+ start:400 stop:1065 length:666 start_codon:yes stop_codon:yes gene_type:complete